MSKTIIQSDNAPAPIGPYSQAVLSLNTLFISGQIALNPNTGEMVQNDISSETHQVMRNLQAILGKAQMTFFNVVKCTIFLKNMDDFKQVNEVYGQYFKVEPPARETVEVSRLPKDANVEISCIAVL